MRIFLWVSLKKYLVAGVVMAVILPAAPVLADIAPAPVTDTTTTTTATADNSTTQTAGTGQAGVTTTPTPDPTTVLPVSTDITNPVVNTTPTTTDTTTTTTTTTTVVPDTTTPPADPSQGSGVTNNTTPTVDSTLGAIATTGDASVTGNQSAGNAGTGNALNQATLINLLNSATGLSGSSLNTFIANITGNVNGNLSLDPSLLGTPLMSSSTTSQLNPGNVSVASNTNAGITNNVDLAATSGNADVSNNGRAGNATTGNATNLLNLINLINSSTTSGQSFLGIINIFGNLNGNILLPPSFLDSLLASNAAASQTTTAGGVPSDTQINNTNAATINNNLNMYATSGNATISDNHRAGDATTGNATNNLNIFNLTGQQIIGSNGLLVFVNVLGSWYGLIMNAPQGATAAELGGGITQNSSAPTPGNVAVNSTTNQQITNNINMTATTGNATVTGNRHAGNATTGNATNSADILNIAQSSFNLSNWFGILFINVFGTWNGNLAQAPAPVASVSTPGPTTSGSSPDDTATPAPVAPTGHQTFFLTAAQHNGDPTTTTTSDSSSSDGSVLGTSTGGSAPSGTVTQFNWILPISGFCLGLVLYLCTTKVLAFRRSQ